MEAAFDAAQKLYASTASSNASFKKIYDHWDQFRADQYLWSQVAELGMDAFQSEAVNKANRER
jgi:TRAP-type mannitol/chloroaromatic compound transport system substrate-binding protein